MTGEKHFISIWFFIGALLTVYGALILGAGIYEVIAPSERPAVTAGTPAPVAVTSVQGKPGSKVPILVEGDIPRDIMAHLHAEIWWGALLLVLGGIYVYRFWPARGEA